MQAIDTDRSPVLPSLMVTTRRRLIPHATSCSFLQAVTQALHSMQRSASQRNFILAMVASLCRPHLTERGLWFLHAGGWIEPVGRDRVRALAEHDRVGAARVFRTLIDALEPAGEMEGHPGDALAHPFGDQRSHAAPLPGAACGCSGGVDLDESPLLQRGEPLVGARLLAAAFEFDQPAGGEDQRELLGDRPFPRRLPR